MTLRHHRRAVTSLGRRGRSDGDRGVTIVEAAFSIPLIFLVILGLTDIGNAVFQTSQASSAAADGARAGIVISDLTGAETSGPAHDTIVNAVQGRLVSRESTSATIAISCRLFDGSVIPCASANTRRGSTQIRVAVEWQWEPVSFVGHAIPVRTIKGDTTMGLVVLPTNLPATTTTTVPTP